MFSSWDNAVSLFPNYHRWAWNDSIHRYLFKCKSAWPINILGYIFNCVVCIMYSMNKDLRRKLQLPLILLVSFKKWIENANISNQVRDFIDSHLNFQWNKLKWQCIHFVFDTFFQSIWNRVSRLLFHDVWSLLACLHETWVFHSHLKNRKR